MSLHTKHKSLASFDGETNNIGSQIVANQNGKIKIECCRSAEQKHKNKNTNVNKHTKPRDALNPNG